MRTCFVTLYFPSLRQQTVKIIIFLYKHEHRCKYENVLYTYIFLLEIICICIQYTFNTGNTLYSFRLTVSCCSTRTRDLAHLPPADRSTRCRWPKRIGTFRNDETAGRKTAILYLPDSGLRRDGQTPLWKYYFNASRLRGQAWYYFRAEITRISLSSLLALTSRRYLA